MSEDRRELQDRSRVDRVLDGAAGIVGKGIHGSGYLVGRVSPKVRRAARALADTRVGQFVGNHFLEGYYAGEERCLEKEAEAEARKILATGAAGAREAAHMFLTDMLRLIKGRDVRSARS